jgi:TRAP-type C4-dicarboxylate transport system permease large subunit
VFLAWVLVTFYYRTFAWAKFWDALLSTLRVSALIFVIIVGAAVLSYTLTLLHMPSTIASSITGISDSKWVILAVMCGVIIIAGCFLTATAITFTIIPIFLPIAYSVGLDPLTFAITYTILAETAMITPPVGINLFVIDGIARDVRLIEDIALGAAPYILAMMTMIVVLWVFPWLTHFIPSTL